MSDSTGRTLRRISWIYPDRGTAWQRQFEDDGVWDGYRKHAADLGLELTLNKPEEVAIDATDARQPKVYLKGERVTPEDTLFVTSLWSLPHQTQDVVGQLFLYTNLERLGFYLPIPPRMSYIGVDKTATLLHLADSPVPLLPTVRVVGGREGMTGHYDPALVPLEYPMIVKPAYWGMGLGVAVVHNVHDLRGMIGLAGGSDTALVAQPYYEGAREMRVYVVEGRAHTVLDGRKEGYCLMVTKTVGGQHERAYVEPSEELSAAVEYAVSRFPGVPYFTLDFIQQGDRLWVSEVEFDGAVGFSLDEEQNRVAGELVRDRFTAYVRAHGAWLAEGGPRRARGADWNAL